MKTYCKSFIALAFALSLGTAANAQMFQKGQIDLNLGVSIGSTLSGSGAGYSTSLPPLSASVDYGVTDKISVGGFLGYASSKFKYAGFGTDYEYKYTYTVFGVRGAYHFDLTEKLDTYAGAMLGYNIVSVTASGDAAVGFAAAASAPALGAFLGARYRFTEKIGAFAELGYGLGYLTLGLNVKLK